MTFKVKVKQKVKSVTLTIVSLTFSVKLKQHRMPTEKAVCVFRCYWTARPLPGRCVCSQLLLCSQVWTTLMSSAALKPHRLSTMSSWMDEWQTWKLKYGRFFFFVFLNRILPFTFGQIVQNGQQLSDSCRDIKNRPVFSGARMPNS